MLDLLGRLHKADTHLLLCSAAVSRAPLCHKQVNCRGFPQCKYLDSILGNSHKVAWSSIYITSILCDHMPPNIVTLRGKFIGCSLHIQQPAAANLYWKSQNTWWMLQHFGCSQRSWSFDVFPYYVIVGCTFYIMKEMKESLSIQNYKVHNWLKQSTL